MQNSRLPHHLLFVAGQALQANTTLFVWGDNTSGQLGDRSTIQRSNPVAVLNYLSASATPAQIVGGPQHALAIDTTGGLWVWGDNTYGQLGTNATTGSSSPVKLGSSSWSMVGVANNTSLGLTVDGRLFAWGDNSQSCVGDGSSFNRSSPVQVSGATQYTWKAVAYNLQTLLLRSDGALFASGNNQFGQLGDGTTIDKSTFVQVGTGQQWISIGAGSGYSGAVNAAGKLYTWGKNSSGSLGDGTTVNKSSPVLIDSSNTYTFISPKGDAQFHAIQNTKILMGWGGNGTGQIGDGTTVNKSTPVQIGSSSWTVVEGRTGFTMGLTVDKKIFCWGLNSNGQLGDNTTVNKSAPVQVGTSFWNSISAEYAGCRAIRADGILFAWGENPVGELGDGTTIDKSSPVQIGSSSWTLVSGGSNVTHAIRIDGMLFAWGNNLGGVLGDGTTINKSSPVQIGSSSWTTVFSRSSTTSAIRADGSAFTWGLNLYGELGDGTTIAKSSPVLVPIKYPWGTLDITNTYASTTIPSWKSVAQGEQHTLALQSDGLLFAWGTNTTGALGDNTVTAKSSPIQIGASSWTVIATGGTHSLGVLADGTLYAWGTNAQGQLGDGTTINKSSPIQIGSSSWSAVQAGDSFSTALRVDGGLFTWGLGTTGRLGSGLTLSRSSPVAVDTSSWIAVACGRNHTLAIRSNTTLWSFGDNAQGQLGDGSSTSRSAPVQIGTSNWSQVAAGQSWSAGIKIDGIINTWGYNAQGQLGDGTTVARNAPVTLANTVTTYAISSWSAIGGGLSSVTAIRIDGSLFSWGGNAQGQLGDGTTINKSSPVQIGTSLWSFVGDSQANTGSGLLANSAIYLWGTNAQGQLGDGTTVNKSAPTAVTTTSYLSPVALTTSVPIVSWKQVSADRRSVWAITSTGLLFAWGQNTSGKLGDGTTINKSSPVQIGSSSWTMVAGPRALRADGTIWCWGDNSIGSLGDGTTISKSSPVALASPFNTSSWTMVSLFGGITINGTIYSWGWGKEGQMGDGNTLDRSVPTALASPYNTSSWSFYGCGDFPSLAIRIDGTLFTWGGSPFGDLGDGTTINKSSPVQLAYPANTYTWTKATGGYDHVLALRSDGIVYTWGLNNAGQLGDGTTVNKSSPVTLTGAYATTSWSNIGAGFSHSMAIRGSDRALFAWGWNDSGQLGNSLTANVSSPIQIGTAAWSSLTIDGSGGPTNTSVAIDSTGQLWTWGYNTQGQLGDSTTVSKSSPIQVFAAQSVSQPLMDTSFTIVSSGYGNQVYAVGAGPLKRIYAWGSAANTTIGAVGNNLSTVPYPTLVQYDDTEVTFGTTQRLSWKQLANGSGNLALLRSDGALFVWSVNTYGNCGDNTELMRFTPQRISPNYSWTFVTAGRDSMAAIRLDGALFTWGKNQYGELGDGTTIDKLTPVQIGTSSWSMVAMEEHTLAIRTDGQLFVWGLNDIGQLGDGTTVNKSSPVSVNTVNSWTMVAVGYRQSAGLRATSQVTPNNWFAWGQNSSGGMGDGTTIKKSSPVVVSSTGPFTWISVSGNGNRAAIHSNGALFITGANDTGQLGDGTTINKSTPVKIGSSSWSIVSCGNSHTMGLRIDGAIFGWGRNESGNLGDGTATARSSPVALSTPYTTTSWTLLDAGRSSKNLALRSDGTLFGWGRSSQSDVLYNGVNIDRSYPIQISTANQLLAYGYRGLGIRQIAITQSNTALILDQQGNLFTIGNNANAEGGQQYRTASWSVPSIIGYGVATTATGPTAIDAGQNFFTALQGDQLLSFWGTSTNGENGLGFTNTIIRSPTLVPSDGSTAASVSWKILSAGHWHSAAIRSDGALFTWGHNGYGQLGDGTTTKKASPIQIGLSSWNIVNAGDVHTVAIRTDGGLFTWGFNNYGQLGNGQTTNLSSPVQIGSLSWSIVRAGDLHTAGLQTTGNLYCWGWNAYGQLGDSTTVNKSAPTLITPQSSWASVSAGFFHTAALRTTGNLYCWGLNTQGQVGDITAINKSAPTLIAPQSSWAAVSCGGYHTAALRLTTGQLWTWGLNAYGQLGDGSTTTRSSPVSIGTSSWSVVSAGIVHTAGVTTTGGLYQWGYQGENKLYDTSFPTDETALNEDGTWVVGRKRFGDTDQSEFTQFGLITVSGGVASSITTNDSWAILPTRQTGDQYARIRLSTWNSASSLAPRVILCMSALSANAASGDDYRWYEFTAGTTVMGYSARITRGAAPSSGPIPWVTLTSAGTGVVTWAVGDILEGRIIGNTLYMLQNGTVILSVTDTTFPFSPMSGYPGFLIYANPITDAKIDYFETGLLGSSSTSTPTQIGSQSWTTVNAGGNHTFAIRTDKAGFGWGYNVYNQLGDGTQVNASNLVYLPASPPSLLSSWTGIASGLNHLAGITTANTVFAWGLNTSGQVGDGTTLVKPYITQITSARTAPSAVFTGANFTMEK